jgi:hypothetical protein
VSFRIGWRLTKSSEFVAYRKLGWALLEQHELAPLARQPESGSSHNEKIEAE